jgi:hypothetical protein
MANKLQNDRGDGQGQGGGRQGDGGAEICECPSCGHTEKHEKGKPCQDIKCPECGTKMVGKTKKENSVGKTHPIMKINAHKRLVYGVVYTPEDPDAQDVFMSADTIETAAHRWMLVSRQQDEMHDLIKGAGAPVESFIVRKNDPDFIYKKPHPKAGQVMEGAWVIGSKVFDERVWKNIMKGDIKSFSLYGVATWGKQKEMVSQWYNEKGEKTNPFVEGENG